MRRWGLLAAAVAAATAVLTLVGAPAAFLLGALVGGPPGRERQGRR